MTTATSGSPPADVPPYDPGQFWDEMFEGPGSPRPHYGPLHDVLCTLTDSDYRERCRARDWPRKLR